jgi:hypothetical protein
MGWGWDLVVVAVVARRAEGEQGALVAITVLAVALIIPKYRVYLVKAIPKNRLYLANHV